MTSTLASEVNDGSKIYRLNQHIAAFVTSLGGFAFGVTLGWNSNAGEILRNILNVSSTEISLVGGILNAGACVGIMFMPFLMKYFSHITAMFLTMPGFIAGWTLICCADQKISLLIIGRFVCGMSGGAFCILTPIYIAEIADQNLRERLLMYFHLLINCGIMYAFAIAHITINVLKNRHTARSFFTCFFAFLTQQLSGANIMIFYALTLFNVGGSGDLTGSEQTVVVGGVQILFCFLAMSLIDIVGRQKLLIASSMLMGLFLILLGWFYKLRDQDPEYDDIYFWMPSTWTILFFAAFNAGVGPISWTLLGDIFPMQIRKTAIACTVTFNWLLSLITIITFGEILNAFGVSKTMWLFAGFCWIAGGLCALLLKNTAGYSLAKIQKSFGIEVEQVEIDDTDQI
ncbi:facilitated trehalose transporter Tret1-like [Pogonomyrmex barbatus]|uniref:Facilitated trehalose transporter Tret1-like n=1 Tax=Pogonomyrmex barbatus TaxID=144034 RepID=A0A8N1S888_9HYME|nr:facilitated trehalose transporter Tret1-like [Pogonomyrmex barbatus]